MFDALRNIRASLDRIATAAESVAADVRRYVDAALAKDVTGVVATPGPVTPRDK